MNQLITLWRYGLSCFFVFKEHFSKNNKNPKILKILDYAAWCFSEKSGKLPNDTSTAVICAFYEDIATHREFWPHFSEWFFPHEFDQIKSWFKYHLADDELIEFENTYKMNA